MGSELVFAFLLVLCAGLPRGGEAVIEGGPSSFGYDASSACGKPYSRLGRMRYHSLPCDFRRENWCTIAGNAYPWQAVRKFVQENQGLMKRMYGDEKHISILKTELEKNEVELELEDSHNHLYSDDESSLFEQFHFEEDYEFDGTKPDEMEGRSTNREYLARSMNSGTSSKLDKPTSNESPIGYRLHPNETPTVGAMTHSIFSKSSDNSPSSSTASSSVGKTSFSHRMKISPVELSTDQPQSTTVKGREEDASSTTKIAAVSLAQIAKIQNFSINEIPGQIDRMDVAVEELTELPDLLSETVLDTQVDGMDIEISTARGTSSSTTERKPTNDGKNTFDDDDPKSQNNEKINESSQHQRHEYQQFRPRPQYRPPDLVKPETTNATKGQLFQDVAAKDKRDPPVLQVRGINACSVKEEVVAPFWANNTRGEVLALLNLYPFEQYVHWEKCTHENKQMYCRDGCRCEQQYRLHRLLAYDPNNECRGIFSDWFKFPSCCICRCYDLPVEFRVTSRSPRVVNRQKIKVRAPGLRHRQRPISSSAHV